MSVYKSISKSIFPSVHKLTDVPAALLGGAQSGYLLLESADFFLLENADKILLG